MIRFHKRDVAYMMACFQFLSCFTSQAQDISTPFFHSLHTISFVNLKYIMYPLIFATQCRMAVFLSLTRIQTIVTIFVFVSEQSCLHCQPSITRHPEHPQCTPGYFERDDMGCKMLLISHRHT